MGEELQILVCLLTLIAFRRQILCGFWLVVKTLQNE